MSFGLICITHCCGAHLPGHDNPTDTFGDTAILTNHPRASSITTRRKSEFLVIDARDFAALVTGFRDEEVVAKYEMIRSNDVLKTLVAGDVDENAVAECCSIRKFRVNEAVVIEGERCESVFFVR